VTALLLALLSPVHAQDSDELGDCIDVGALYERVPVEASGVRSYAAAFGANLNDFDADGDVDVFVATGPAQAGAGNYLPGEDLLYLNPADGGSFEEGAAEAGVDDLCEDRAPLFGDLDNDGRPDLYVTVNGPNVLYRGQGEGRFEDVSARSGAAGHPGFGHQGVLSDTDRDGYLDVFFVNDSDDGVGFPVLLRNQRDGTLRDVTADAAIAGEPSSTSTCVLDADLDGWPDLLVASGTAAGNQLFMNQQDGTFADEAIERGMADQFGAGLLCEDLDGDGDADVILTTHDAVFSRNRLVENRDGMFSDVSEDSGLSGVAEAVDGVAETLFDADLDGATDVLLAGVDGAPRLYLNNGDLTFTRACEGAGLEQTGGRVASMVAGDLDQDGYPEVLITNGVDDQPRDAELFHHVGGAAHYLIVEPRGITHNPSQVGARVEVEVDGRLLTRNVGAFASGSQGPLPVVFGLGDATRADVVRVVFTNGAVGSVTGVDADQTLKIDEPAERADADFDGKKDEWDVCPGTRLGSRTDGEGCALGQRNGVSVGLVFPIEDAVMASQDEFRWEGDAVESVVQISLDGTFGPAARIDWGPTTEHAYAPNDAEWAELVAMTDGTRPLLWRVAAYGAEDGQAISEPRRFHVSVPSDWVQIPLGTNMFMPAHVVLEAGAELTWWNDPVADGLAKEPHAVQLVDEHGRPLSVMHELNEAGFFTWAFTTPGTYYYLCHRHSGTGASGDGTSETPMHIHPSGPYRCMSGSVTVRQQQSASAP
jgi:plastocyanin